MEGRDGARLYSRDKRCGSMTLMHAIFGTRENINLILRDAVSGPVECV